MEEAASAAVATHTEAFIPTLRSCAETMEKEIERLPDEIEELQARVFALERALTWTLAHAIAASPDLGQRMNSQLVMAGMITDTSSAESKLMAQTHFRGVKLYQALLQEADEFAGEFHAPNATG